MPLPSFCVRSSSDSKQNDVDSQGCQHSWHLPLQHQPPLISCRHTPLPCTHVESHWTLTIMGPLKFCAMGLLTSCMWTGRQGTVVFTLSAWPPLMRLLHCCLALHLQTQVQRQNYQESQNGDSGALNPAPSAPEYGALCDGQYRSCSSEPALWLCSHHHLTTFWLCELEESQSWNLSFLIGEIGIKVVFLFSIARQHFFSVHHSMGQ